MEWPGDQTLAQRIASGPVPFADQLRILGQVAAALAHCHSRQVVHRNLSPASIYVDPSGQVRVGDFDFARVPAIGQTISKTGQALVDSRYTAPEQLENPRQAGAQADLYSLGAIWYSLLFRTPDSEPVRLALVAKSELPEEARQLLRSLLAPHPSDRPGSSVDVREWLDLLAEAG